jgi:hypothetical protein
VHDGVASIDCTDREFGQQRDRFAGAVSWQVHDAAGGVAGGERAEGRLADQLDRERPDGRDVEQDAVADRSDFVGREEAGLARAVRVLTWSLSWRSSSQT